MPYSKHDTEITQDNIKKGKIAWTKLWNVLGEMSEFVFEQEITRFTFDIDLDFALEPHETMQKLDSICRNYTFVYGYRPRYMVNDLSYRAKIKVQIYCPDPVLIINNHDSFMGDIIEALHGTSIKKEGDTK